MNEMIRSTNNPEVIRIAKLHKRKHREQEGQFIVEGPHLVDAALSAFASFQSIYCTEHFASTEIGMRYLDVAATKEIQVKCVSDGVMKKISDLESPQGILGVVTMPPQPDWKDLLRGGIVVIVDRVQDPGNLGTILRTADSAGVESVLLLEGSADAYNSKAVRSSMGSIFHVPILQPVVFTEAFVHLKESGYQLIAADMDGECIYHEANLNKRSALVIGNEGQGIANEVLKFVDVTVRIPLLGNSESLNVAVACGIILYEILRQNK